MSDTELIEQFNRDGCVAIENAFNLDEVERMQHEANAILELILNSSIGHGRRSRRLDMVESETGQQMIRKIQPINDLSLYLAGISTDERFLGPMRTIMGDEPVLMEEKLNYKEPLPEPVSGFELSGRPSDRFPIHSDWAYYKRKVIRSRSSRRLSVWTIARKTPARFTFGRAHTNKICPTTGGRSAWRFSRG